MPIPNTELVPDNLSSEALTHANWLAYGNARPREGVMLQSSLFH